MTTEKPIRERMIKARLKQWGYLKNAKREDWYYLAILLDRREVCGRTATEFVVRGHRKTVKDLKRFVRNQSMQYEEFLREARERVGDRPVPKYIRAMTPDEKHSAAHSDGRLRHSTPSPPSDNVLPSRRLSADKAVSALDFGAPPPRFTDHQRSRSSTLSSSETDNLSPVHTSPVAALSDRCPSTPMSSLPTELCQQPQQDLEDMSRSLVHPIPLGQRIGDDDMSSWTWIRNSPQSDSSGKSSMSTDFLCSRCHQPSQEHFIRLRTFHPQSHARRDILNGDNHTLHLPISTDGEGSWTWVSRCFLASMCLTRGDHEGADLALGDASREFERLLITKDTYLLTAALMVMMILHMHDQGTISKRVMRSAAEVSARLLEEDNPIRATIEHFTHCADLSYSQTSSDTVMRIHDAFSGILPPTHPYMITSQYNYMFMLKWENKLEEAEAAARACYTISRQVFGEDHMQSIAAQASLAGCLCPDSSRRNECIRLYEEVIAKSQRTLGLSHLYPLEAMRRMAGKIEERDGVTPHSAGLHRSVLLGRVRRLGRTHAYTIAARDDYEAKLKTLGWWEDIHGRPSRERQEVVRLFDHNQLTDWSKINHIRHWSTGSHQEFERVDMDGEWSDDAMKSEGNEVEEEAMSPGSLASSNDYLAY